MSKLVYLKGLSTNLSRHSLKDGQILFTEDTGELYIDYLDSLSNKIIRQPIHDKELAQALQQYINSMNKVENKSSADIRSEITADDIENALGFLPVEELSSMPAEKVTYDNTESGLNGINVQAALDEVVEKNAVNQIGILTLEKELEDKASKTYVDTSISNLVDGAPETLNTLNELSAALRDDPNFATTVATQIGNIESDVKDIVDGTTTIAKATSAIKLATARTIRTNLGSTSTASFDGTANITPGVTGTLPVANGGTGATTTKYAQYNLLNDMNKVDTDVGDESHFVGAYITPSTNDGVVYKRTGLSLWNYIKSKISTVLGLTETNYKGTATKATSDANGNVIPDTYATKDELTDSNNTLASDIALNRQTLGYSKKNLLKNTATTKTANGITFTVNEDGSVTVNGTATANPTFTIGKFTPVPNKAYIFTANSEVPGGNSSLGNNYCFIYNIDGVPAWKSDVFASDGTHVPYEFTPTTDNEITCQIYVAKGKTVENLIFYPMIRSAEITDGTYEPYVNDVDTRLQEIVENYATKEELSSYQPSNVIVTKLTNEDLNTLKTGGRQYYGGGTNTCTNKPDGVDAFALNVYQSAGGWYTQELFASNNKEVVYIRYYNSSAWTAWKQLAYINSNVASATKATQDANGNNIANTYATKESVNNKVDKEKSKGLSTNDYTTAEKNKLSGIETGATKTTVSFDKTNHALLINP